MSKKSSPCSLYAPIASPVALFHSPYTTLATLDAMRLARLQAGVAPSCAPAPSNGLLFTATLKKRLTLDGLQALALDRVCAVGEWRQYGWAPQGFSTAHRTLRVPRSSM